jgi:hypothetical protein
MTNPGDSLDNYTGSFLGWLAVSSANKMTGIIAVLIKARTCYLVVT